LRTGRRFHFTRINSSHRVVSLGARRPKRVDQLPSGGPRAYDAPAQSRLHRF